MRLKKDIIKDFAMVFNKFRSTVWTYDYAKMQQESLKLEILVDIRDELRLLNNKMQRVSDGGPFVCYDSV